MVGGCEVVITHTGHTESTYSEYQNTIHCVQRSEIVEQRLWCSQPWAPFAWEWSCKLRCLSSLIHWSLPFSYTYSSSVWKSDNPTSHHSSPSQPWRPALFAPPLSLHLPASFTACWMRLIWGIVHAPSPALLNYWFPDLLMMLGIIKANRLLSAYWAGMSAEPPSHLRTERQTVEETVSGLLWKLRLKSWKSTPVGVRQILVWVGKHWQTLFILVVRCFTVGGCVVV